jgi:hypothetical protein
VVEMFRQAGNYVYGPSTKDYCMEQILLMCESAPFCVETGSCKSPQDKRANCDERRIYSWSSCLGHLGQAS